MNESVSRRMSPAAKVDLGDPFGVRKVEKPCKMRFFHPWGGKSDKLLVFTILALVFLALPLTPSAAEAPSSAPSEWLGRWRGEKALAQYELRLAENGIYEVVIAWVSPEAGEEVRAMEGQILVRGLVWDTKRGEFIGGTAALRRDGKVVEVPCELLPRKEGTLEFRVSQGLFKRSILWSRP